MQILPSNVHQTQANDKDKQLKNHTISYKFYIHLANICGAILDEIITYKCYIKQLIHIQYIITSSQI